MDSKKKQVKQSGMVADQYEKENYQDPQMHQLTLQYQCLFDHWSIDRYHFWCVLSIPNTLKLFFLYNDFYRTVERASSFWCRFTLSLRLQQDNGAGQLAAVIFDRNDTQNISILGRASNSASSSLAAWEKSKSICFTNNSNTFKLYERSCNFCKRLSSKATSSFDFVHCDVERQKT